LECLEVPHSATVSINHYKEIYRLLQCSFVGRMDDLRDPLTVAMVRRANAHLQRLSDPDNTRTRMNGRPADGDKNGGSGEPVRIRQITIPEVSDLGQTQSKRLQELLKYVREKHGIKGLMSLGVDPGHQSSLNDSKQVDDKELASWLLAWSLKQVRTRFDYLRRNGIIAAVRHTRNGPWQYQIPEHFVGGKSSFSVLPSPEALEQSLLNQRGPSA
jgi:hypothetical protein